MLTGGVAQDGGGRLGIREVAMQAFGRGRAQNDKEADVEDAVLDRRRHDESERLIMHEEDVCVPASAS
jgi:hypothetical protein